jgi:DNA (cytosine-5)-methyltransferase 1
VALTILSLFSGVGGLDLGIKIALPGSRVLGYVERDAYAAAVLLARMADSSLEPAPVWIGDVQDVDGSELRGRVDIICGGFPCQDISVAGKGVGITGKRSGLWSEIVRLAGKIRPRYIFLENVSAIITRGLDTVLADLAALRFDAEWMCLRASDVGAPHRRERWFCLADSGGEGREGYEQREALQRDEYRGDAPRSTAQLCRAPFPPGPADHDAWRAVLEQHPHLAPAIESGVRVLADGLALVVDEGRADQLRCAGNGVVSLQAAVAFTELLRRIGESS